MAKFFIAHPVFAIVLSIIITLVGLISAFNVPIDRYPRITPPHVSVEANYRGANSQVVEKTVAQVLEQQINGIENMVSMLSTSADSGSYQLDIQFELEKDPDTAVVQTQNRVAQANSSLPQSVSQAGVTAKKVSSDFALVFALWSPNGTYDSTFMKNYGDINIIEDLKRVKGVGNISEYGADFSMRIWLQPDKMAKLGVTTSDIAKAINEQNVQAPAGTIGQRPSLKQEFQYTATVQGRLTKPEEFAKIVVRSRPDGSFIRLGDVAKVEIGGKNYSFACDLNGHPAIFFMIQPTTDANLLETVSTCQKVIEDAAKRFPPDLSYKMVIDTAKFVRESLKEVIKAFVLALLLVLLVVFLFLQSVRATLIPMLAIPVSLIGTFGAFLALGFSINTLTMFAMVLTIGLVVDDAIVVIEAVEHHMRYNGLSPYDATVRAMNEVSGPVIAIAFVLASIFIPVAFIGGMVGILYKQFALTIAISMGLSAIVALSLTPALCTLLLKPYQAEAHSGLIARFFGKFNSCFEKMVNRYGQGVAEVIHRSAISVSLLIVLMAASAGLFRMVPTSFVPPEDQGYYLNSINLPEAASLDRTQETGKKVCELLSSQPGVEDIAIVSGLDLLTRATKPNTANMFVGLKHWDERTTPELQVDQEIRQTLSRTRSLPEASVLSFNAASLPGVGSMGGFTLMLESRGGTSDEEMDRISKEFLAAARKRPEIGTVYSNFRVDTPGYRFEVDRDKVKSLGIPVDDVFNALQVFLGGLEVNDFNIFDRTYKVVIQAETQFRSDVDASRFFFVRSASGKMVPLNTLIKPEPVTGPSLIQRFNSYRAIKIGGTPASGYSSGQALTALEEVATQTLPKTFSYEWSDQSREEKISGGRAPIVFCLALLFMFLCLAALYESWSIPLAIILCIPTGVFGAFLFQYVTHLDNNIYMQIGLVMLIGLMAKNAILIVEFAKVRVDSGMEPVQAAIEAATIRLRPILMTSLAFIIGCIPLALATGAGAGARKAMGTAVVGGMLVGTVLGIFLIPVLFVVIEKVSGKVMIRNWLGKLRPCLKGGIRK
ncbi:efflux RND transporter permease subunit [Sporomusa acidovorans]|uniref:Efflux pump membrane transporter BepE n=1 Tax=Sporomusa acidovorans (strain ATCC 49682 / DSM 3132 / Mol) TaxID=1123286 RepID=A0ABZ3J5F1_SPOA4|nr:multidrug efflux RND transporter permease subunit [Sporomusa acidovorans]OZC18246.1 efflux pump membrane transporter BepE [Sporomusa acidovorans DSM 3132]SDF25816.1 hydrophobe/amphiphile efflux-1 (HAE1) family protein [Sporomusa acidovorans]